MSTKPEYIPLPRAAISVRGADWRAFLQGLLSNDVNQLPPDGALYACLLSPQGKFLHDLFVLPDGDGVVLECESGARRDDLLARLTRYKLRAAVTIEMIEPMAVYAGFGPAPRVTDGFVYADPRHANLGWRIFTRDPAKCEHALLSTGYTSGDFATWDRARILLGVMDGSRDATLGISTLDELNIPALHGVSFTKGCYIGQELTARMEHRGLGKKHLQPVRVENGVAERGELRSVCGDVGLALVRTTDQP